MTQQTFPGFGVALAEKIECSIEALRMYEAAALKHDPEHGYWGCFSGGKDSVVIKQLAADAGVKVRWHYNDTTIDPPELRRFIRKHHADVVWERPERSFFRLLVEERGYPLRHQRWCCQELKERGGRGRVKIAGVRYAESPRRKNLWKTWQRFDATRSGGKASESGWMLNPVVYWSDADVWAYIRERELPYCELYDEGWSRLGCVGCPMAGAAGVRRMFNRWPKFERAWRLAFRRLWARKHGTPITRGKRRGQPWPGMPGIETADELFEWWMSGDAAPLEDDGEGECQMGLW